MSCFPLIEVVGSKQVKNVCWGIPTPTYNSKNLSLIREEPHGMKLHVSYKGESTMNSTHKILLLLLALCIFSAESADPLGKFCNSDTSIKSGSKISANIDRLLSALISKTSSDGFTATSYGEGQDKVFGLAQCRGMSAAQTAQVVFKMQQSKSANSVQMKPMHEYGNLKLSFILKV
jgi:hypothetical protein